MLHPWSALCAQIAWDLGAYVRPAELPAECSDRHEIRRSHAVHTSASLQNPKKKKSVIILSHCVLEWPVPNNKQ